jgi:hypothetical protein
MAEAENTKTSGAANRAIHGAMAKPSQESLKQVATPQRKTVGSSLKPDVSLTPRRTPSDLDFGKSSLPESSTAAKPTHVRTPQRPATQVAPSSSKTQPNTPSLGPVFSPVRQVQPTPSSPSPRRVSYVPTVPTVPFGRVFLICIHQELGRCMDTSACTASGTIERCRIIIAFIC